MGGVEEAEGGRQMLRDAVTRALSTPGVDAGSAWAVMSGELGLCGLGIEESQGGLGGGALDVWAVMEAQGAVGVHTPFLSAMVLGAGVLKHVGGANADRLLQSVAEGTVRVAVAYLEPGARNSTAAAETVLSDDGRLHGRKVAVLDAEGADVFVVSVREAGGVSLLAVPAAAAGLTLTSGDTIDGGSFGDLAIDGVVIEDGMRLGEAGQGLEALEHAIDEAVVAVCAGAVGAMDAMVQRTTDYVKQRQQFGHAIGDFQVVQHRLVEMLIASEQAAALARVACGKLEGSGIDRAEAVSGAKVLIADACRQVSQGAVQLHGGIGTTEELDLSIFFRSALMAESLFGDATHHLRRYEKVSRQKMERDTISVPMENNRNRE